MVDKTLDEYMKEVDDSRTEAEGQMCEICGEERATNVCIKCGKHVCARHFVNIMGLCVECAPVKVTSPADKETTGEAENGSKEKEAQSGEEKPGIEWV